MKNFVINPHIQKQKEPETESCERFALTTKLCLAVIFISCFFVGILPQTIINIAVLLACIPLITTKDIYLVYPVMIFYSLQFGQLFGINLFALYSAVFLMFTLFHERNIRINKRFLAPFILFLFYCIIVIIPVNILSAFLVALNMFCIMILVTHYLSDSTNLKKFFKVYVLIALVAFFTGTQIQSKFQVDVLIGNEVIETVRNCATFEDPNYMGFFYTIAIFSTIALKLFNPKFRVVLVIALYAMLFSTLSITAIVVNAIAWVLYLWIAKKINLKTFIIVLLIIAILLGLYSYGKEHPDTPIFGMLANRLSGKLEGIGSDASGDLSDLTTGRSDFVSIHFDYFMNQPIWRMFFGMNAASALTTDLDGFKYVGHNEYVDWLLNVGILGAAIMLIFLLKRTYSAYKEYKRSNDTTSLCILFVKIIWISYAFTLTVYGDFRFFLPLFL